MLSFERLKELKAEFEQMRKYNDRHYMSTITEDDVLEVLDEAIARQSVKSDIGETSDGYHTFNELYEHRTALFATLCNMRSDISWKSMKHDDETMYDGMFIAGIETPDGQYTYHCEMKYWYMFAMTKEIEKAPSYDGHQPSDYPRLLALSENSLYRQSVKSEDVQVEINRLKKALEQTREAAKELKEQKYAVNMLPVYNQIKSLELQITSLQAYQLPSAIKWTGNNLREVINLTDWNESASSKWTWEEYEQVVKEKGLKIFTPDGSVFADIGSWIVRDGNDCFVLQAYQPWIPVSERLPTEEDARQGMVLAWSSQLDEWQVETVRYVKENTADDYTHWKSLPEPPKGE